MKYIPTKFNKIQINQINQNIIIDWDYFQFYFIGCPCYIYCSINAYQRYKYIKFQYLALHHHSGNYDFYKNNQNNWSSESYTLDELKQLCLPSIDPGFADSNYYYFASHRTIPITNTELNDGYSYSDRDSFTFALKYKDQISPLIVNTRYCLTQNTLITMADYSQKQIKNIQIGQKVLTINQITGQLEQNIVLYNSKVQNTFFDSYDIYYFENNYKVQTLNRHRFYNVDKKAFIYMDEWHIGQRVRTIDGKELKLLKSETIKQKKQAFSLTIKNQTYIANNMFTGTRYAKPITPFDI